MEALTDMADGEESRGIQVGQHLNQDVCWQPAEQVIKHHKGGHTSPDAQSNEPPCVLFPFIASSL